MASPKCTLIIYKEDVTPKNVRPNRSVTMHSISLHATEEGCQSLLEVGWKGFIPAGSHLIYPAHRVFPWEPTVILLNALADSCWTLALYSFGLRIPFKDVSIITGHWFLICKLTIFLRMHVSHCLHSLQTVSLTAVLTVTVSCENWSSELSNCQNSRLSQPYLNKHFTITFRANCVHYHLKVLVSVLF